ncbi:MAG: TraB/GumN family protein [Gammaproteobacteria bacterium]|nr:TraB/GumN family protein [Gammaproteobacteria bacterium]
MLAYFLLQPAFASSPVWLVESAQNHLFLAGTIHVLRASDQPLPAAFETAYEQSQMLAFETDIGEIQSPAFQQQLVRAVTLDQHQTLQDLLTPETRKRLHTYFLKNNINLEQFSRFKPSMIAITLTLMELKKLGAGSHGVDQYYFDRAKDDQKKILALESPQQQIDFLAHMGEGQEDLMIQQTLKDIDSLSSQFPEMISSWRKGDSKQLESLFVEPMQKEFDAVYQQLLVQRNAAWIPQIINYLKTSETEMVLIGAAHLVGSDGLITQLKQAGYKITQLD